ncbi:phosphoglucosamine mutase [Ruminococcaceae bacterium OttesenSCG-928-L11]|nr:phosphoglucosamine mutase [Ruminococcaceae bacterium OttesenSCG-928-L11]
MGRIFGTDGARGVANTEISCKLAMNIGRAAAMVLSEQIGRKPTVLIGKDTRISSDMLEAAITAGLCSVGADVIHAGVLPTPAIAYLITEEHADGGIMLSASHNPYEFNGIKIFGPEGYKLTDAEEFEIEEIVLDHVKPYLIRWGWELGRIRKVENLADLYIDHIAKTIDGDLSGMKIAVDCSNGSASSTAEKLFTRLGATVDILSCEPNGININKNCGSTHIDRLCQYVKEGQYDAGIAFDGDADRCIAVDETGEAVDGDQIMAILATDMKAKGKLKDNAIVATVMSNMGLFRFAADNGIQMETTKVGDRYVLEQMRKKGFNLGGEQSGHVILSDHMSTGDGQLTAIQLMAALKSSGKKFSELKSVMTVYPQVQRGIRADAVMKAKLAVDKAVELIIAKSEKQLNGNGRILVRASGTEPLIRVMIEGADKQQIEELVATVADQLEERLSQNEDHKRMEGY